MAPRGKPADRITAAFSEGLRACSAEVSRAGQPCFSPRPSPRGSAETGTLLSCLLQVQQYGLCLKATLPDVRGTLPPGRLAAAAALAPLLSCAGAVRSCH